MTTQGLELSTIEGFGVRISCDGDLFEYKNNIYWAMRGTATHKKAGDHDEHSHEKGVIYIDLKTKDVYYRNAEEFHKLFVRSTINKI